MAKKCGYPYGSHEKHSKAAKKGWGKRKRFKSGKGVRLYGPR